ncbi:MAG: tripartite tricarboxylate transporter permease, partial [Pseudomonadota bacterium]
MDIYLQAVATVLQPFNVLIVALGVAAGVLVGALPGLSSTLGLALLIPVTFGLDPVAAFLLLGGMYSGSVYGGSITAILIN